MYNISDIESNLLRRHGFRNPTKTAYQLLTTPQKATVSGRYYQSWHSLVSVENIHTSLNDSGISEANFQTYLDNMVKDSIHEVLSKIYSDKDLMQNWDLYTGGDIFDDTISNESLFVGYEIKVPYERDVTTRINTISLSFNAGATFNIYLYHNSKKAALESQSVTPVINDTTEVTLNWDLNSKDYSGGYYYIGYFQDDIGSAEAYDRSSNLSDGVAGFRPMNIDHTNGELLDIDEVNYSSKTYGMNLDISAYKDYTDNILTNVQIHDEALGMSFAIRTLELIVNSGRINGANDRTKEMAVQAYQDLEGFSQIGDQKTTGLYMLLDREINKIKSNLLKKDIIKSETLR